MIQQRNFDTVSLHWDEEPRRVMLARDISASIQVQLALPQQWDALDFGCGTGLVTMQLAPLLQSITGIDSSSGMLDRLKDKIKNSGYSNVVTELCDVEKGTLPTGTYHLITSAMTLHHIENVVPLLTTLKTLLHPGGWVALADLASEDGSFHEDPTGIFHHGFAAEELTTMLEESGFTSISITAAANISKGERNFPVLLATAQSC